MKKFLTVLAVLFLCVTLANAQGYRKGVNNLNVGIGFGLSGIYGDAGFPPVTAGLQIGIHEKFSVGGIVGYSSSSYGYANWEWTYSYILIGARGEYHFLEPTETWDAYGGVTLGYNIVSVSEPSGYTNYFGYGYTAETSYALFGFHVGARYLFTPSIGVFGELGYGIGYITVGANFRL
ncbi:MAG: hypothetical protein ACM3O3_11475 [Syntrophothermus sp.]|nr:hypothetical protein [Ignavibacteriaceae bacterium]